MTFLSSKTFLTNMNIPVLCKSKAKTMLIRVPRTKCKANYLNTFHPSLQLE